VSDDKVIEFRPAKPAVPEPSRYACPECDSIFFTLWDTGDIQCANPDCETILGGVLVVEYEEPSG